MQNFESFEFTALAISVVNKLIYLLFSLWRCTFNGFFLGPVPYSETGKLLDRSNWSFQTVALRVFQSPKLTTTTILQARSMKCVIRIINS